MDYSYGAIYEHKATPDDLDIDGDDLCRKYGLNIDECYIMYSEHKIEIEPLDNN